MPKLTKQDLQQLEYVSMKDYFDKIEEFEDFNDKLEFTTYYLLKHGMKNADCSFEEAVYMARIKLTDESLDLKKKYYEDNHVHASNDSVNPYATNKKDELKAKMFLTNPEGYLKGYAEKISKEIKNSKMPSKDDEAFQFNTERLSTQFLVNGFNEDIYKLDRKSSAPNVISRTVQRHMNRKNYDKAYEMTKGGFFSRLFRTSSNEYKNFERTFKAFNDPNDRLYGDMDSLENAINGYVQLKIPGWQSGQEIREADFQNLSRTERVRLAFFDKLLIGINNERKNQNNLRNIMESSHNIKFSDLEEKKIEPNQEKFQNDLDIQIEESNKKVKDVLEKYDSEPNINEIKEDLENN